MKNQYQSHLAPRSQQEPLDSRQVLNAAGGYAYEVDAWQQLRRFLVMGTTGGTFYINERDLTKQNVASIQGCIAQDGPRVIKETVKVSHEGLAPSNDPALFVLALAISYGDAVTKREAAAALGWVARTPTHLFHFVTYALAMRRWGRVLKDAVANWYKNKPVDKLALHLLKYQSRDEWSNRDLLRLSHPKTSGDHAQLLGYAVGKVAEPELEDDDARRLFVGRSMVWKLAEAKDWPAVGATISAHRLAREMLPTEALNHPEVWSGLLDDMPLTALLRNLGNLAKHGVLDSRAIAKLTNAEAIRKARVHPLSVLVAMSAYSAGQSRSGMWQPSRQIVDALEITLREAMLTDASTPVDKKMLVGVDVSGSMRVPSTMTEHFDCSQLGGALACVLSSSDDADVIAYHTSIMTPPKDLLFTKSPFLWASAFHRLATGGTDCSLPLQCALNRLPDVKYDAIINITDSETWAGIYHAPKLLKQLRDQSQKPVKYVNIQMAPNRTTVADPQDKNVLETVGFDVSALPAIKSFVRGEL